MQDGLLALENEALLPPDLLAQVQAYIDGEYLYIPRRETSRKPWGAANGRKAETGPKSGDLSALSGGDLCGPAGGSLLLAPKSIWKIIARLRNE